MNSTVILSFPNGCQIAARALTSDRDKELGYQHQEQPPKQGTGLLFVFWNPGIHRFHMNNVLFPLTLVSFDKNMKCLGHINMSHADRDFEKTWSTPHGTVYALEMSPSDFERCKVKSGDVVQLRH